MITLQRGYEFAHGFRLQEYLGRGQFGQVWRASAPGGTPMAVKFIENSEGKADKEFLAIERIKQIQHANVMTITAIWLLDEEGKVIEDLPDDTTETRHFADLSPTGQSGMVMMPQKEPAMLVVAMLLGGKSLQARLKECLEEGKLGIPPRELLSYMEDAAKGLDFLNEPRHDLGDGLVAIQHCDVKPANIVLYGNAAMLCDFGLARILTRNQATADNPAGTPMYMAPEAIQGAPSQASDQYAFAVTYYHLRTGVTPIQDSTLFEVLDAHRRGALAFEQVPSAEQEVLRRATHLDWTKRFPSNVDFVDHLRDCLRGVSSQSRQVSISPNQPLETIGEMDLPKSSANQSNHDDSFASVIEPTSMDQLSATDSALVTANWRLTQTLRRITLPVFVVSIAGIVGLLAFLFFRGPTDALPTLPSKSVPFSEQSLNDLILEAKTSLAIDTRQASEAFSEVLRRKPNLATPQPIQTAKLHRDAVETLLLSKEGNKLISTGYDNQPFVWKTGISSTAPLGNPARLMSLSKAVNREAISLFKGGRLLAAGAGKEIAVWDLGSISAIGQGSVDAKTLIPNVSDTVLSLTGHTTKPETLIAGIADQSIQIFQLSSQQKPLAPLASFDIVDVAGAMKVDKSGQWLFVQGQNEGQLVAYQWSDIVSSEEKNRSPIPHRVTADGDRARRFAFPSKDRSSQPSVIVGSENGTLTLIEMSDVDSKVLSRIQPHSTSIEAICVRSLSPEENDLVITGASDGSLCECSLTSLLSVARTRQLSTQPVSSVDVTDDGRWIAAGTWDGHLWFFDRTISENRGAKIPVDADTTITVESIKIDEFANVVLVGCSDGAIRVWSLENLKLIAISQLLPDREIIIKKKGDSEMI